MALRLVHVPSSFSDIYVPDLQPKSVPFKVYAKVVEDTITVLSKWGAQDRPQAGLGHLASPSGILADWYTLGIATCRPVHTGI